MLQINGADPLVAVDANAEITGSFQGRGTRQNSYVLNYRCNSGIRAKTRRSFFATYNLGSTGFTYNMGNFGQMALPLADSVTLTVQRVNSKKVETITVREITFLSFTPLRIFLAALQIPNCCLHYLE